MKVWQNFCSCVGTRSAPRPLSPTSGASRAPRRPIDHHPPPAGEENCSEHIGAPETMRAAVASTETGRWRFDAALGGINLSKIGMGRAPFAASISSTY